MLKSTTGVLLTSRINNTTFSGLSGIPCSKNACKQHSIILAQNTIISWTWGR